MNKEEMKRRKEQALVIHLHTVIQAIKAPPAKDHDEVIALRVKEAEAYLKHTLSLRTPSGGKYCVGEYFAQLCTTLQFGRRCTAKCEAYKEHGEPKKKLEFNLS